MNESCCLRPKRLLFFIALAIMTTLAAPADAADCPRDSVRAGTVCIDRYEASVWEIKPQGGATSLSKDQQNAIESIRAGNVTLSDLKKAGAVQLGIGPGFPSELEAVGCAPTGNGCTN